MSLFNKVFLLTLLLIILSAVARRAISASEDAFILPNPITHVTVYNYLESKNFTIHCKSKDDDLGTHVIAPGNSFTWKFQANLFVTTLFFCGVEWQDGHGTFDIYKAKRDLLRCPNECLWKVKSYALVGYNDWEEPDILFRWKPN